LYFQKGEMKMSRNDVRRATVYQKNAWKALGMPAKHKLRDEMEAELGTHPAPGEVMARANALVEKGGYHLGTVYSFLGRYGGVHAQQPRRTRRALSASHPASFLEVGNARMAGLQAARAETEADKKSAQDQLQAAEMRLAAIAEDERVLLVQLESEFAQFRQMFQIEHATA
jgi:hypothetical protein